MSFVSHSALISISLDTSLLNVPFSRFPQVLSSPTCPTSQTSTTSTSFCGSRNNPRVSARWSGMSGRTANPTQNTGYEPNFHSYLHEEHTPINFPDSFQCRDGATIISAAQDTEVPCSGPSSSSKQTAAGRVPIMLGSLGASPWKQRPQLVDNRASIQATGTHVDRESVISTILSSQSKERSRSKRCAFVERQRKSPENPWTDCWLGRPRTENGSAKTARSWSWSWGGKLGKATSGYCFSGDQSRIWISTISTTSSKSMGRSGSER